MPTLKTQISELISEVRLDDALSLAKQQALSGLIEFDTTVTLLSAEWNNLKKAALQARLTYNEESTKRQDLAYRLLSVAEDMDKALASSNQRNTTAQPRNVILFLGANPFSSLALELEREMEYISAGLMQFGKRDAFDFRAKMHVTPTDLQRMLLEAQAFQPRFVHFAGNAVAHHPDYGTGVVFEDEDGNPRVVKGPMLATIFRQFPSVECVFLNTCDSGPSAFEIGQQVKYAIGMNARVYDEAAIDFAVAFYEAIAGGNGVPFAFEFAQMRLQLGPFPEQATLPVLISNRQCTEALYIPGDSHIGSSSPRIVR